RWRLPEPLYIGKSAPTDQASIIFDPVAGARLARQVGWKARRDRYEACFGHPPSHVETLDRLSKAHMAAAIAAGFFNGHVLDSRAEGGRCEMVKGRTIKHLQTVVNNERQPDGSFKRVAIELFRSEVFSLDAFGHFRVCRISSGQPSKADEYPGV